MGGHGGLNILPQKKWNVYNRDNKAKVEKDRRIQDEKKEKITKNINENQAESRYELLKRKKQAINEENKMNKKSEISKELEEIAKNKHVNLFDDEEKINIIEANRNAKLEKEKKNLPYDETSKFLGVLDEKKNKPWYINLNENKPDTKKIIKPEKTSDKDREFYKLMKDFQVDSSSYFKVIDNDFIQKKKNEDKRGQKVTETKKICHQNSEKQKKHKKKHHKDRSRSRSNSKERKNTQIKEEKLAKLREERLKRELLEKKKVIELINKISS